MFKDFYIPLRIFSSYSIGESNIRIEDVVKFCKTHKIPAFCITDRNDLFGMLECSLLAKKNGIQYIPGLTLKVRLDEVVSDAAEIEIVLIATNERGVKNLTILSSLLYMRVEKANDETEFALMAIEDKVPCNLCLRQISEYCEGLIVLWGTADKDFLCRLNSTNEELQATIGNIITQLKASLSSAELYIEISRVEDNIFYTAESAFIAFCSLNHIPIVASCIATHMSVSDAEACDVMMCISNGTYIATKDRKAVQKGEFLRTYDEFQSLFADLPKAVENTIALARKCSFMPQSSSPRLPTFASRAQEDLILRQRTLKGLEEKVEKMTEETKMLYFERLQRELDVICSMGFSGYFLVVSDFIRWSRDNDIAVGPGRGSAVGSIVAWVLNITALDPIKFNLLFERFLNPARISMPDIDVDFCQLGRDRVIEYVKKKYGSDRVAHIITFGKLQPRAVLRDVGRVLQIPYRVVDRICKMIPNNPAHPIDLATAVAIDKSLQEMSKTDDDVRRLIEIGLKLEGLHRHISMHSAGVVISDTTLLGDVPLCKTQDSDLILVQYSMKYTELAGLVKFDFLGLKTLTVIAQTCNIIKQHRGIQIDISNLPLTDVKTFEMLTKGLTVGVFQFEGVGMKEAIKGLKPDSIDDLIALSSLYRPGPMSNIPSYNRRKHGLEAVEYIHPRIADVLKDTYGIIIYQEQVIEIARVIANYSLGEADLLRRAMGKKDKNEMAKHQSTFIENAVKNGIEEKSAIEIFDTVNKFASYGFNKSHAAAYSIISYQTAYLKAHYPIEFLCILMNLDIMQTNKLAIYCNEARLLQIQIKPPSINFSYSEFMIEGNEIRYGLEAIKGVSSQLVKEICAEREKNGTFKSILDFIYRIKNKELNKRNMEQMIKACAFAELYPNIKELLENVENLIKESEYHSEMAIANLKQNSLFKKSLPKKNSIDELENFIKTSSLNDNERAMFEYQALGFYLLHNPLQIWRLDLQRSFVSQISEIEELVFKIENEEQKDITKKVAGIITSLKVRSSSSGKGGKFAFMQLCDETGFLDVSIFNEAILIAQKDLLAEGQIIVCNVEIRKDNFGVRITVESVERIDAYDKVKDYIFPITDFQSMKRLSSFLDSNRKHDGAYVRIATHDNENNVIIVWKSKSKYDLNNENLEELKNEEIVYIRYDDEAKLCQYFFKKN
ncbi:DNA polymerase III subunit alpha [Candidatus Fokinia solitaria]|uniref:DNA polymerase III subunit alpha n=1 Tax=Candidatus Fokinia solitaria TaxID=1802984 RepID=A0A2U8BSQ6_9RICK|nr:DNA polymerase III subunit alpha [Candidatus Fokinia solitaria]AWD33372.1 DNA polymerase III subunit alpha [Candidatus Fokinia solitaria]